MKGRRKYYAANITLAILAAALPRVSATEPPPEEYRAKGAYLLNFVKFVDWPDQAFKGPGDPIAICILGTSPFGAGLVAAAQTVVVGKRSVTVLQITDLLQARQCQIVFLSVSERRLVRAVIDAVQGGKCPDGRRNGGFRFQRRRDRTQRR